MHNIIFDGQLVPGHAEHSARKNLATLLKTDNTALLDRLFSGQPVTLKKNLAADEARRYLKVLNRAGLMVRVDPPLADDEALLHTLSDFPALARNNALGFNTVMQSFSHEPLEARDLTVTGEQPEAVTAMPPAPPRWLMPVLAVAAAVLVCATVIFWPTSAPPSAPLSAADQANLEHLFAIAASGDDAAFEQALSQAPDTKTREAMRELRQLAAEESLPPIDPHTLDTPTQDTH